jgi:hypothetical protein
MFGIKNAIPSSVDEIIIFLNIILASAAAISNIWWARLSNIAKISLLHSAIGLLAAGYAAAYSVLLFTELQVHSWSSFMRGVSLVAWTIAWTGPALIRISMLRRGEMFTPEQVAAKIEQAIREGLKE